MRRPRSILRFGLSALLAACAPVVRPDGGKGLLPVGATAPEIVGAGADAKPASLAACRGHESVVYFYPKDETPGCTREACAFRDTFPKYASRHMVIFGVSRDSEESHKAFRAKHDLPFVLVADQDGAVARSYGVSSTLGFTARVTFLVGPDGRIARVWPDVDPSVHAAEVLAAVDALEKGGIRSQPSASAPPR